jgi:hypothetical protein
MISTALWLDAADAATVTTVSGAVSQWNDKSGNGRNASQATAGSRPTVASASQNSLNGISFDGVDDRLGFSSALLNATHSLFILFKPTLEAVTGTVFGQWQAGQTGRYIWNANQECSAGTPTSGRLNLFNQSATGGACGGGGFTTDVSISNTATLVSSISTTGSEQWKLLKNGTEWDSATIASVFTGVNSSLGSVNAADGSAPYDGVIYEVIHLASYASTDTRQRIEGYLAWKWGLTANLPAGHPYKTVGPTTTVQDEYRNNVSLLLHGNGTNGSTVITDSGPLLLPVTAVGNAQISTAVADPFGNSSRGVIAFDGNGDYLSATSSAFAFDAGNFTLEGWFYFNNGSENAIRIMYANYTAFALENTPLFFGKHAANGGKVSVYFYNTSNLVLNFAEPTLPPSNQWVHYALVRAGNIFTIYRDGTATASASHAIRDFTASMCNIGGSAENASYCHNGYIDDLRITKGVARYTSNFTPPTAPFPDF